LSAPSASSAGGAGAVAGAAAAGACAFAAIALGEIAYRLSAGAHLTSPRCDFALLAAAGAFAGGCVGLLRLVRPLSSLSPFGVVLGIGVGLEIWLPEAKTAGTAGRGAALLAAGAIVGQLAFRRMPRPRLGPWTSLLLVALLLAPGLRVPRGSSAPGGRPNVLLLTVDTLRADRLGATGEPRPVSPHLDRLARRGVLEVRTVTPLPRTLPAIASVMTGTLPHTHGVRDNFHYSLGPESVTLAERFRAAGWSTGAVNSNPVLSHASGVYQGFESASDRGDDWSRLTIVRGARRIASLVAMRFGDRDRVVTDLALEWLRDRPRDRPFFLWVHWLAPHMPYEPEFPFDRVFDPDYDGEYRGVLDYGRIGKGDMTYRNPLDARTLRHAIALYDGEVATADRAVGRLLREMERAGDLEHTVVAFTSDHGESLVEHGYFFNHGDFVYGPAATVPLVLATPDGPRGLRRRTVSSLVDVAPTLWTAATGEQAPPGDGVPFDVPQGRAFGESDLCRFPDLNDRLGGLLPPEIARSPDRIPDWKTRWEAQANRAKQRFVEEGGWKLVLTPRPDGDRHELFDLAADPGETNDVSSEHPERTHELALVLRRWIAEGDSTRAPAGELLIDDAAREQLDALGYTGD
jgi:arylsulfatase A-like enzyme